MNSRMYCYPALANAANSFSSNLTSFATAQAMLAMSCALNSLTSRSAALVNAANSFWSNWPGIANAQAVLATSYALNSLISNYLATGRQPGRFLENPIAFCLLKIW